MSTQLSIRDIRVLKIHFSIGQVQNDQSTEEERDEAKVQFNFTAEEIRGKEDEFLVKITQSASLNGTKQLQFSLVLAIGGIFSFDPRPVPEELERFEQINCNAILFPYLREAVSDICKRGGLTPIFLPPLNFAKMYRDGVFEPKGDASPST